MQELLKAGQSQRCALALLGVSRGSWHARANPRPGRERPVAHTDRVCSWWLTPQETAQIRAKLEVAFGAGQRVFQAYYEALDAGEPVASLSSWYRVARACLESQRPVTRQAKRRSCAMPQWSATAPMQVWSWDITKLKGPYLKVTYDFYVVIDVFSRKIVAWRVEEIESDRLAEEMFKAAFTAEAGQPATIHSDGGASMTSTVVADLLDILGIERTKNRPRVSNDNPFSESWFKTAKYSPGYPPWFESVGQARDWAGKFVTWYNTQHRHSSLEGHTPTNVHDGSWIQVHHARYSSLEALRAANPTRYPKSVTLKTPYATVALNPQGDRNPHRLTTG